MYWKNAPRWRILVAGVGNIFFGDDAFGSEVARALQRCRLIEGVAVVDYGIGGMHLAYDLLDGWDSLVLIDTIAPEGAPGRVEVIEVDIASLAEATYDPHGMDPCAVLASIGSLGGVLPQTFVVGCEPALLEERIGLSPEVAAAIPLAVSTVIDLVTRVAIGDETALRKGR